MAKTRPPIKRVRLAESDPYGTFPVHESRAPPPPADPPSAAPGDPPSPDIPPNGVHAASIGSGEVDGGGGTCPPARHRLIGKQHVPSMSGIITSHVPQQSVASLCDHFELSPRPNLSDVDVIDPRSGKPYVLPNDSGVIEESISSMDDVEPTAPSDSVLPVPNVKPVVSLKALSFSKNQRKKLSRKIARGQSS